MTIGAALLGLLVGVLLTYVVLEKFRDRGFRIFACTSVEARDTLVSILGHNGLPGRFRIDSSLIKRALLSDRLTVLNWTDPELWHRMGSPAAAIAIVTRDPAARAVTATVALRAAGFTAEIITDPDPDVPAGRMVFVNTNAFEGTVLVYRRHITKMGPRPPRWVEAR